MAAHMEPAERTTGASGEEAPVPYNPAGGINFNPSQTQSSMATTGYRETVTFWIEVDPQATLGQLKRDILTRLRVPLLQQRVDDIMGTGDHDDCVFASSELHWTHSSASEIGATLAQIRSGDMPLSVGTSTFKLSIPLPGTTPDGKPTGAAGMHIFGDSDERDNQPLYAQGLLEAGLTLRLTEFANAAAINNTTVSDPKSKSLVGSMKRALGFGSGGGKADSSFPIKIALAIPTGGGATTTPAGASTVLEEIEVKASDSLLAVKERMGKLLLKQAAGWTEGSQEALLLAMEAGSETTGAWDGGSDLPLLSPASMAANTPALPNKATVTGAAAASSSTGGQQEGEASSSASPASSSPRSTASGEMWRLREGNLHREGKRILQEFRFVGASDREKKKRAPTSSASSSSSEGGAAGQPDLFSCESLMQCGRVQQTVGQVGLREGSVLLLERGAAPVAGLLRYPLYLWQQPPSSDSDSDSDSNGGADKTTATAAVAAEEKDKEGLAALSMEDRTERDRIKQEAAAFTAAMDARRRWLRHLGFVLCHEDMPPASLRALVWAKCQQAAAVSSAPTPSDDGSSSTTNNGGLPVDARSFLVRELRSDLLPGRTVAYGEDAVATGDGNGNTTSKPAAKAKTSMTMDLMSSIGKKPSSQSSSSSSASSSSSSSSSSSTSKRGGKGGKGTGESLLNLGLPNQAGVALVVDTLLLATADSGGDGSAVAATAASTPQYARGEEHFRLWVQAMPVPVKGEVGGRGGGQLQLPWPPIEASLRVATKPSLQQLFDCLSKALPSTQGGGGSDAATASSSEGGTLRVFKWWAQRAEWREVAPDPSLDNLPSSSSTSSASASNSKGGWSPFDFFSSSIGRGGGIANECETTAAADALRTKQKVARKNTMKMPAALGPTSLTDGDLFACFVDPALPVEPRMVARASGGGGGGGGGGGTVAIGTKMPVSPSRTEAAAATAAVLRGFSRLEDDYLARLIEHQEHEKRLQKSAAAAAAGVLSTGEVSGARAIAARNAAQKGGTHVATAAAAAGGKMRAEATLTIGDLDFSSDEDEVGGGEGEGDASA
jgi:hypothetical protein